MCCVQLALSAGTLAKVLFKRKTWPYLSDNFSSIEKHNMQIHTRIFFTKDSSCVNRIRQLKACSFPKKTKCTIQVVNLTYTRFVAKYQCCYHVNTTRIVNNPVVVTIRLTLQHSRWQYCTLMLVSSRHKIEIKR